MLQVWPRRLQGRRQSEDQTRQYGERESEKQDALVNIELLQARQIFGAERDKRLDSQPRQAQTASAARRGDQQTFGQQLPDQSKPMRAQGRANRNLFLSN